jgi:predicted CoA-substrate-specific enzyme activase
MQYVAGIDVGSRTTKCVILDADGRIVGQAIETTGAFLSQAAERALTAALRAAGLTRADLIYIASTGWGRYQVPFRDVQITDITCHARGAVYLYPATRTVLDIGAQNTRAIRVEPNGRVRAFRMNNRCAAGAGRFLERTAAALEVPLEEMGAWALRSQHPERISSICAVLAESEVINLVSHEARIEDILAGVHQALVERIASLVRQVGAEPELTLTGGVAQNVGMVHMLRQYLGMEVRVSPLAVYAGAIGAALLGWNRVRRLRWGSLPAGVRPLTVQDAPRIAEIDAVLTGSPPDPDRWTQRLRAYTAWGEPALCYETDGQLVGYALGFIRGREFGLPDRSGWVEGIGVDPRYQHRGIGRVLLEAVLTYFRNAGVREVYTLIPEAWRNLGTFFQAMAFQPASLTCLRLELTESRVTSDESRVTGNG